MLSGGRTVAVRIGTEAGTRIQTGTGVVECPQSAGLSRSYQRMYDNIRKQEEDLRCNTFSDYEVGNVWKEMENVPVYIGLDQDQESRLAAMKVISKTFIGARAKIPAVIHKVTEQLICMQDNRTEIPLDFFMGFPLISLYVIVKL